MNRDDLDTQSSPPSGRTLIAVFLSMVFLIVALVVLLVETTWVHPANATESPPAMEQDGPRGR